jgi:hypothetical protein
VHIICSTLPEFSCSPFVHHPQSHISRNTSHETPFISGSVRRSPCSNTEMQ